MADLEKINKIILIGVIFSIIYLYGKKMAKKRPDGDESVWPAGI